VRVENGKQIGDLSQFVDYDYLARIITANLSYDTELRWNANPESDVVDYEIMWRNSTSPLWTHSRRVGNVTDATIKNLNKDDVQVGVRDRPRRQPQPGRLPGPRDQLERQRPVALHRPQRKIGAHIADVREA
jgi:hypothetical protein